MRFPANNASQTSCKTRTRFTRKRLLQELIIAFRGISAADCVVSIVTILGWVCLEACSSLAQFFNNRAEPRPWSFSFPLSHCVYCVFLLHYSTLFLSLAVSTKSQNFLNQERVEDKEIFCTSFCSISSRNHLCRHFIFNKTQRKSFTFPHVMSEWKSVQMIVSEVISRGMFVESLMLTKFVQAWRHV